MSESIQPSSFSRPQSGASTSRSTDTPRSKAKRSKVTPDDILSKVNQKLNEEKVEDDFDTIGKVVANKLRKLSADTATIAEKFILDILFEAQVGNIDRNSKLNITQTVPVLQQSPVFTVPPNNVPPFERNLQGQQLDQPRVFNVLTPVERNVPEDQLFNTATYLSEFNPNR